MTAPRKSGKTGSRNPAAKPTSVTAWKKSTSQAPPIQLPSGNYMRLKKVGLQTLVKIGIMPNSLMEIVTKTVDKGTGKDGGLSDEQLAEMASDPKKVAELAGFMDSMVCFVAQEPEVHPVLGGVERDPNLLYVDEIDEEDKAFIFQVVTGGTTDVEQFRKEQSASMAAIRRSANLELPTE